MSLSLLVVGTGFWGAEWLRTIPTIDDVVLAGTAGHHTLDIPAGVPLASGHRDYSDYVEAIAEAGADAVVITLPTPLHADAILRCIEAGRHVLCEKPLAQSVDEVSRLLAAASRRPDVVVMVQQNYRRRPWAQLVRSKIQDGTVGRLGHIGVRFRQPEMLVGIRAALENPLLQDMGIHHMDLLRFLSGRNAVELYARASIVRRGASSREGRAWMRSSPWRTGYRSATRGRGPGTGEPPSGTATGSSRGIEGS